MTKKENNKEKVCLKVSMPLFEEKELEIFDNNIHNIIEEYSKLHLEKKEQILTQRIIIKQEQEINRLNNIIKNLDKMFEYYFLGNLKYDQDTVNTIYIKYVKLKELKGDNK